MEAAVYVELRLKISSSPPFIAAINQSICLLFGRKHGGTWETKSLRLRFSHRVEQPEKEGVRIHSEKVTKQMGDSKNRSQDCSCKWLS